MTHHEKIAALARAKTLNAISQLDGPRNSHVLRFLYETMLLSSKNGSEPLDISTANFTNINRRVLKTVKRVGPLNLNGALFGDCFFTDLFLEDVDFSASEFMNVNFSRSYTNRGSQTEFSFSYVRPYVPRMKQVNFTDAKLQNIDFTSVQMEDTYFNGAELKNISFRHAQLTRVQFVSVDLINVDFSHARLAYVDFSKAQLKNVNFSFAVFDHVDFYKGPMVNIDFSSALLHHVTFLANVLQANDFQYATLGTVKFLKFL